MAPTSTMAMGTALRFDRAGALRLADCCTARRPAVSVLRMLM